MLEYIPVWKMKDLVPNMLDFFRAAVTIERNRVVEARHKHVRCTNGKIRDLYTR